MKPKPYDVTGKDILRRDPPSWLAYFRLAAAGGPIDVVDADLSTVSAEADWVYRVGGRLAHLIHVEMQSHRDARLPRRLWRYNALLDLKFDLRVRSVALLLRPEADAKDLTGVLELRVPDDDRVVTFHYKVIRAWEQPVEPLLVGPLATLPMAPLADVPLREVPRVLERIDSRLAAEAPPAEAGIMMLSALTLAGMRLVPELVADIERKLRTMNLLQDSSYYQVLLQRGKIAQAKNIVIRQGQARFGRLPKAIRAAIEAIDDLERLDHITDRILTAKSWNDLLEQG